jgi:hypothetical protein
LKKKHEKATTSTTENFAEMNRWLHTSAMGAHKLILIFRFKRMGLFLFKGKVATRRILDSRTGLASIQIFSIVEARV